MMKSRSAFQALALAGASTALLALAAAPAMAQDAQSHLGIPVDKIGVVSYTIMAQLSENPRSTLEAIAACGIENVEFSIPNLAADVPTFSGVAVPEIKALTQELGLSVPSLGVGGGDVTDRLDLVVQLAKELGATYVRISGVADVEGESVEDHYKRLASVLNTAGAALAKEGITLTYHNHDAEFRYAGGGKSGYGILLAEVDPANANFELDLYWSYVGNSNAIELIEENPGRFKLFHVKDAMEVTAEAFSSTNVTTQTSMTTTTVGNGLINFKEIFDLGATSGVEYYFIESDFPLPDGITSVCDSYAYMTASTAEAAAEIAAATATKLAAATP